MEAKKLESTFINMLFVLTGICLVSSFALGVTYTKTKDAIAAVQVRKKVEAIKNVTPPFDNNPDEEMFQVDGFGGLTFYPVKKGGNRVGTAVKTFSSKGFSGNISLMVGFDEKGRISGTSVLQHAETPGLGSKMDTEKFRKQFMGQDPRTFRLGVKKDGGDVDAITAATITSRAFCDAVKKAADAYEKGREGER